MKKLVKLSFLFIFSFILIACSSGPKTIVISPDGNQMKYQTTSFEVKAGETVKLVMKNTATAEMMKHNVVILNDNESIDRVGKAALTAPNYLPQDAAILAATPMANAGQTTEIEFTAPSTPGKYPYICTFPGHYMMMQGVMIVN